MEDRNTPGLYLEMTELPLDAYARDRVPEVLGLPGVDRATWWRNVHRDRDDLPARARRSSTTSASTRSTTRSARPSPPAGITGHHFRRYRRPGQGVLTGRPTIGLSLVLISPKEPERAQELRDWADFVHIRHIAEAAVPGYAMITPYENATGGDPRFMHFYEMDTDDPERAFKAHDAARDRAHRRHRHRRVPALGVRPEPADHVRELVRARRRQRVTDDLFAVVSRQRACRAFSDAPVTDAEIAQLLEAATHAPSAENRQPWEFVVVRDAARAAIGDLTRRAWEAHGRAFSETRLSPKLLADVDRGATGGIAAAPVHIVVCADIERGLEATVASSIFPAVQNLLLAATALGLGSALTTITTSFRSELAALLALPAHVVPVAVVPVGRPAKPLGSAAASRSPSTPIASNTDRRGSGDAADRDRAARAPTLGRGRRSRRVRGDLRRPGGHALHRRRSTRNPRRNAPSNSNRERSWQRHGFGLLVVSAS